ncbi:receptor-interacting serine/threonine-protein kinase 2 [Hyla sarda]|uniref:receptor-interacting serine/threonine-protein kinase 2 n=1 Tax=Hyla sarda TaxID=327740 RepID=UPI0024C25C50|nr:receptor-interacting serine/threonine-protein kinase 2 [Hyla sarda]
MNSTSSTSSSSQEHGSPSPAHYPGNNSFSRTSCISSNLQDIPYEKLTDLRFINKGAYGTVHSALHSDWRIHVAVKFFPKERHLVTSERNKILKEAEILHKARFSYILPILGICNEEDNIGIVTEYMPSGSLNQLLHEDNPFPEIAWPLRFRILYEIALGVNFLHNMSPPLLHHDLKTPNILLDSEYHVKIADFGLSKWRMLSQSFSDQNPPGGTIIYMPPEMYEPSIKNSRGSVKHDMYSYAIIMWEVLSRKQPYEGAKNPMQVMFSVANGNRPDISEDSLSADIPYRDIFVSLIQSGWAADPNDRPAFLKCLLDMEPVIKRYDEIAMLEGILQVKKEKNNITCVSTPSQPVEDNIPLSLRSMQSSCPVSSQGHPMSLSTSPCSSHDRNSIPTEVWNLRDVCKPAKEREYSPISIRPEQESPPTVLMWIQQKRDQIIGQMTEACLNQCLDALISKMIILMEDYELIKSQRTRSEKVRNLIDTCDLKGELFANIIVQKLKENRQSGLQPFPDI